MEEYNAISPREDVETFIEFAKFCAAGRGDDVFILMERRKNKQFMDDHNYLRTDVINLIRRLRIGEYSHTSWKDKTTAYVFGLNDDGLDIYMKLSRMDKTGTGEERGTTLVISFHEQEWPLEFPYRKKKGAAT